MKFEGNGLKMEFGLCMLHDYDALPHLELPTKEFLTRHDIPLAPHPHYSRTLASNYSFTFPQLKSSKKGRYKSPRGRLTCDKGIGKRHVFQQIARQLEPLY
jgi:hypothetical protein